MLPQPATAREHQLSFLSFLFNGHIAPSFTTSSSFLALGKKEAAAAVEGERETENKHIEKSSDEEDDDAEAKMEERGFDEEDALMRHMHDCHDGPPLRTLTWCSPLLQTP